MSKFPPKINCCVCGTGKGETNHWYLVTARKSNTFAWTESSTDACTLVNSSRQLVITDFTEDGDGGPVCGNNCTQKLVERWLQTGSLEPPRGAAGDVAPRGVGDPA